MGEKTPFDGAAGKASIRIETGAALQAANACRDVIAVLKGCQALLAPGALNNYSVDAIGGDDVHAKPLKDRFIEETRQASDSVGRFIDALHDMGDMFKAAGAVYTGNDKLSAGDLEALKNKKNELSGVSTSPGAANLKDVIGKARPYLPPDYEFSSTNNTPHNDDIDVAKKPTLPAKAETDDVFKPHARTPSSMTWKDLQNLGQRIEWNQVSAEVPTWKVLADQVETVGLTFQTAIRAITTSNWESKGGDAAFTAVQGFVGSLGSLRQGFLMMHGALQYTVDFLHATAASMPVPADGETCDDVGEVQELYKTHYYDGFDAVQTMYPVAAEPTVPKGALGPPPPEKKKEEEGPGKRDDGTGNGGGNQGGGNQGGGSKGGGSQGGGNQGGGNDDALKAQREELANQKSELQKQREQLTEQQRQFQEQINQNKSGAGQGGAGQTGGGGSTGAGGAGSSGSGGSGSKGSGGAGSGGTGSGSSGSTSGSGGSPDMSSMISAITGIVSSVTQALPSVIEALSSIDLSGATPDLSQLTQALGQFPDLRAAISDSPEFATLMAEHPELVTAARSVGLTVDEVTPIAAPAAGLATGEPATASVGAAAFPRAALPDFSNLGSLGDIVAPIVAASAEVVAPEIPEFAEASGDVKGVGVESRS
ncbi:cell division protein ZapB [Nocardia sp. NPDC058519]|uniref:cell division protein ZapB n=1 Tax=Nocardia sp. NPDC058519 TaxID=3346535 RepID=UPI00364CD116